jgi:hypothetical protein
LSHQADRKAVVRSLFSQADFVFVLTLLALGILALLFGGWLIADPPIALSRDISPLSPRMFPTIVLIGLVGVAVLFVVNRVRGADALWQEQEAAAGVAVRGGGKRLIAFLFLLVASALVLNTVGFLTTMFVLMAATSLLVGNANLKQILALSITLPFGIYVIVTHFLRTALPELDAIEGFLAPLLAMLPSI